MTVRDPEMGERVVVAVCSGSASRDVIRWALANKIKCREDTLIFLHVVSKIPSAIGGDMNQGEVNNTMFVHYVRTVVQPMMLQLKKLVPSKVKLELKVARSNLADKAIVEETKKLRATVLLVGSPKGAFNMGSNRRAGTTGTAAYCINAKVPGVAVFVIQKDKVVIAKETDGASSDSSAASSPGNSGRVSLGFASAPKDSSTGSMPRERSAGHSGGTSRAASEPEKKHPGSGEVVDEDAYTRTPSGRLVRGLSPTASPGQSATSHTSSQHGGSNKAGSPTISGQVGPTSSSSKTTSPATRLLNARSVRYSTWNGVPPADLSAERVPPSGLGPEKSGSPHFSQMQRASGAAAWSSSPDSNLSSLLAGSPLLANASRDVQNELSSWSQAIQQRHQLAEMDAVEDRLAKARTALAMFPATIGKHLGENDSGPLPKPGESTRTSADKDLASHMKSPGGWAGANESHYSALLAGSPLLDNAPRDVQNELSSWSAAIQERHNLSHMDGVEDRLAKARAELAMFPATIGKHLTQKEKQEMSRGHRGGDSTSPQMLSSMFQAPPTRSPAGWRGNNESNFMLANSPLLENTSGDIQAELSSWSQAIHQRHHVAEMNDVEDRLAKARAAMAMFPATIERHLGKEEASGSMHSRMESGMNRASHGGSAAGWGGRDGNPLAALLAGSPLLANASGDVQDELSSWSRSIQERHQVSRAQGMEERLAKARAALASVPATINEHLPDTELLEGGKAAFSTSDRNDVAKRGAPGSYAPAGWGSNNDNPLSSLLADSPLLANASGDVQNEFNSWSQAIQERHQVSYMNGVEGRMAKARAALASMPATLGKYDLEDSKYERAMDSTTSRVNQMGRPGGRGGNDVLASLLAGSPLLANASEDIQDELNSWSQSIQERQQKVGTMKDAEARMAKAKAALASMPATIGKYDLENSKYERALNTTASRMTQMGRPAGRGGNDVLASLLAGSPLLANASEDIQDELNSWSQSIQERQQKVGTMKDAEARMAKAKAALASMPATIERHLPNEGEAARAGKAIDSIASRRFWPMNQAPQMGSGAGWASGNEGSLAGSPLFANTSGDVQDELTSWSHAIHERHQVSHMKGMEDRLAKARAALASFPATISKHLPNESSYFEKPADASPSCMSYHPTAATGWPGSNESNLSSLLGGSPLFENTPRDIQNELDAWSRSIQQRHHVSHAQGMEDRLAKARAALASVPATLREHLPESELETNGADQAGKSSGRNALGIHQLPRSEHSGGRVDSGWSDGRNSNHSAGRNHSIGQNESTGRNDSIGRSSNHSAERNDSIGRNSNHSAGRNNSIGRNDSTGRDNSIGRNDSAGRNNSSGRKKVSGQAANNEGNSGSRLLDSSSGDIQDELSSWSQSIQQKHQLSQGRGMEDRLAKARAALASFPETIQSHFAGNDAWQMQAERAFQSTVYRPNYPTLNDDESALGLVSRGSGIENALLKELAVMRKRAAEAERARSEAERRAEQLMAAATYSLQEVELQTKRREMENAAIIERANREAQRAMYNAEEVAQKTEAALKQAHTALELEAQKRQKAEENVRKSRQGTNYRQYSWEELSMATENFRPERKIGEGGFGTVYSATLYHTRVAVKVLKNTDAMQAAHEFRQEVEVLGQIQHPHTVMLLGCCPERYALVYEFMANGSLEERLACKNGTLPLPWYARLRIAAEVASALLSLHNRPVPIVHRDLKPANILLDKNYSAKIGDVGLARLMPELNDNQTYMRDSSPVGTFAYVDPEFQRTGEFGPKSDVYALGIILLDLLTGRKPATYEELEDAIEEEDHDKVSSYLDEKAGRWPVEMAMEVAKMATRCSEMRRRKRPDLEMEVMPLLERVRDVAVKVEDSEARRRARPGFGDAPSSLFCPITQEIMVNPVLASDGHTYELVAIQQWLEKNDRSPMTNVKLPNKDLVPNHAVRSMIQEWSDRHN